MTTMESPALAPTRRHPWWLSRGLVLVTGVLLVPFALSLMFNSWGPLTHESALRMAFAHVAGMTIAILSALAAVVISVATRRGWASTGFFAIVALFVIGSSSAGITNAGDLLEDRMRIVSETDLLNR